jgi:hypothetical protein
MVAVEFVYNFSEGICGYLDLLFGQDDRIEQDQQ